MPNSVDHPFSQHLVQDDRAVDAVKIPCKKLQYSHISPSVDDRRSFEGSEDGEDSIILHPNKPESYKSRSMAPTSLSVGHGYMVSPKYDVDSESLDVLS